MVAETALVPWSLICAPWLLIAVDLVLLEQERVVDDFQSPVVDSEVGIWQEHPSVYDALVEHFPMPFVTVGGPCSVVAPDVVGYVVKTVFVDALVVVRSFVS